MVDFNAVNDMRHLDIAMAALKKVGHGSPFLKKVVLNQLSYWRRECRGKIDEEWINQCKGLISGED